MMSFFKDLNQKTSLRVKFFIGIIFLLVIMAAGLIVSTNWKAGGVLYEQLRQQGDSMTKTIAMNSAYYVQFSLKQNLEDMVNTILLNDLVVYVDYLDGSGRSIASSDPKSLPVDFKEFSPQIFSGKRSRTLDGQEILIFAYPILDPSKARAHEGIDFSRPERVTCHACHNMDGTHKFPKSEVLEMSTKQADKLSAVQAGANIPDFALGYMRIAYSTRSYHTSQYSLIWWGVVIFCIALGLSVVLIQFASRLIIGPITYLQQIAAGVARGDLTHRLHLQREDELGKLTQAFNQMTENLESMVSKVKTGHQRLTLATHVITKSSQQVMQRSENQVTSSDLAYSTVEQLNAGIKRINENVEALSTSSEETSSSILEMVATMEEVSKHTDTLFQSVEETANATTEMVASINEVDRNMDQLANFVSETSASMIEMDATINEVERNAAQSYEYSVEASKSAEEGMHAVQETISGMANIQKAVREAEEVIGRLGSKSEEIGKIVNVIDDIAEQTNLLALNAAILAAQAGEHGKGFSVVATEIRNLSERTASSTKEISNLIRGVQEEVRNAIERTKDGVREAQAGSTLANQAGRILEKILESSLSVSNMVKEIAKATREQAKSSQDVTKSVERVREMAKQVSKATSEQAAGSQHIMTATENMREGTRYVQQATQEQRSGSMMISKATEQMMEMIHGILEITSEQAEMADRITQIMGQMKQLNAETRASIDDLRQVNEQIQQQSRSLEEEIQKFKIHA
jgi:methyl-accepting chemotaxis protein